MLVVGNKENRARMLAKALTLAIWDEKVNPETDDVIVSVEGNTITIYRDAAEKHNMDVKMVRGKTCILTQRPVK